MVEPLDVYLGLGANVGDREAQIHAAVATLAETPGIEVLAISPLHESEPVGGPPQGAYLNGAVRLRTTWPAEALLALLKELERAAGRDLDAERNAPRPLDLDILLYGDLRIDTLVLQVPHPRLGERPFVRGPLIELGVDVRELTLPERPAVIRDAEQFAACNTTWLEGGCRTGLVTTMGALHEGHASLLRVARRECDRLAATIFVNPLQFGVGEDLDAYPRTFDADLEILRREGTDAVFVPSPDAMYPPGFCTRLAVGAEAAGMEGASRPDHFVGVATVVAKLLALARPRVAYFGQKDAQQLAVIRRLVRDLQIPVELRACPTRREPDGLAMSSRNVYLSPAERAAATVLWRGLCAARERHAAGERDLAALVAAAAAVLRAEPLAALDYVELRRDGDLAPLPPGEIEDGRMLIAARIGTTRLIDNATLRESWDEG